MVAPWRDYNINKNLSATLRLKGLLIPLILPRKREREKKGGGGMWTLDNFFLFDFFLPLRSPPLSVFCSLIVHFFNGMLAPFDSVGHFIRHPFSRGEIKKKKKMREILRYGDFEILKLFYIGNIVIPFFIFNSLSFLAWYINNNVNFDVDIECEEYEILF